MKAESIEQIREHLARGGRVVDAWGDEVDGLGHVMVYLKNHSSIYRISDLTPEILAKWQLLPLEEKEPVEMENRTLCDRCMYLSDTTKLCPPCKKIWDWLRSRDEPVDHGTQKGQEEECIEAERAVHIPVPCEMRLNKRIRTRLLHGMWPEVSDLMAWWEATTGERIEWGKRCERCKASGRVKRLLPIGYDWITCLDCNGSGYSVRPTWMGDVNG